MKVEFVKTKALGDGYFGRGLTIPRPGVYEVPDGLGASLVADFPLAFRRVDGATPVTPPPSTIPNLASKASAEQAETEARARAAIAEGERRAAEKAAEDAAAVDGDVHSSADTRTTTPAVIIPPFAEQPVVLPTSPLPPADAAKVTRETLDGLTRRELAALAEKIGVKENLSLLTKRATIIEAILRAVAEKETNQPAQG